MRSRGVLWSVVIVVVLAAAAFAGWRYLGVQATAEVYAEAGQPRCDGVEVGVGRQDDGLLVPSIPLREETFRASGCTALGTLTAPGAVVVRGGGDERTVPLPLAAVFRGTEDSNGCDT